MTNREITAGDEPVAILWDRRPGMPPVNLLRSVPFLPLDSVEAIRSLGLGCVVALIAYACVIWSKPADQGEGAGLDEQDHGAANGASQERNNG